MKEEVRREVWGRSSEVEMRVNERETRGLENSGCAFLGSIPITSSVKNHAGRLRFTWNLRHHCNRVCPASGCSQGLVGCPVQSVSGHSTVTHLSELSLANHSQVWYQVTVCSAADTFSSLLSSEPLRAWTVLNGLLHCLPRSRRVGRWCLGTLRRPEALCQCSLVVPASHSSNRGPIELMPSRCF